MEVAHCRKVLQKQLYDIISHRYGLLVLFIGAIIIVLSSFYFGESVMEWSTEKYAVVFNSFSDNLAGRSYRERLCLPVPIDVVYTWVNGTDPQLIRNLKKLKLDMQVQLNMSSEVKCIFSNCLPSNTIVLFPALLGNITLTTLTMIYPEFSQAKSLFNVTSPIDYRNFTAIGFTETSHAQSLHNRTLWIDRHNTTVIQCYITSDSKIQNGVHLSDQIIMSGFPHTLNADELKLKLPVKHQSRIDKIEVNSDKGVAVLYVSKKEDFDKLLAESNFTIDGKEPTLNPANLVWDLRDFSRDEDISASRFEDNEELRYSLRSVERFAPWVRHIYIVTNGQIPHWLNLENPRITIVTHTEIFANTSHLPTFGSPAIESNLHRIPGLSDKFIYMNDDVLFGTDVWPDDFYTHSSGQKVYLTWPVPNCNEGCPSNWIKDGYCDKACNVSECEFDAGDCDGSKARSQGGWAGAWSADNTGYCHTGCANNWIADRYCDTACNVLECGFDAGDCGTEKYDKLYGLVLLPNQTHYILPAGLNLVYFNISHLLVDNNTITKASYDANKVVRAAAIAKKFKVFTLVLLPDYNKTSIHFTFGYGWTTSNLSQELNFTLEVNTVSRKGLFSSNIMSKVEDSKNVSIAVMLHLPKEPVTEAPVVFADIPADQIKPQALFPSPTPDLSNGIKSMPHNMSDLDLPKYLHTKYIELQQELEKEELTVIGYNLKMRSLWIAYQQYLLFNLSRTEFHKKLNEKHSKHASQKLTNKNLNRLHKPLVGKLQKLAAVQSKKADPGIVQPAGRKLLNAVNEDSTEVMDDQSELSFVTDVHIQPDTFRLFPWEQGSLAELQKILEEKELQDSVQVPHFSQRRLLDTFGDSLRHVNTLYNRAFGYTARKVPGHMPHMVDKNIMAELQARFPAEWDATSSHKIRHSKDMQYAFAYFYYLMGIKQNVTAAEVFDEMDTDKSRVLSDRELRTLATRLYELPLDLQTLANLEFIFVNCSKNISMLLQEQPDATSQEMYYEKEMPQVTRNLFINCPAVSTLVRGNFPPRNKYRYQEVDDSEIAFKMIKSNVSVVVGQLDDIRKHPKKFICLNDNIDHNVNQANTVKAILADFYESLFPLQSQFELPQDYHNRFTNIDELREWRKYRDWLKFWTHIALILLVLFTVASYFADKIEAAQRRFSRRQSPGNSSAQNPSSTMEAV